MTYRQGDADSSGGWIEAMETVPYLDKLDNRHDYRKEYGRFSIVRMLVLHVKSFYRVMNRIHDVRITCTS